MVILVRIIGIVICCFGVAFLLRPQMLKQLISFIGQGKRLYAGGIIRILAGIILLLAARQCRITWIVVVFGVICLIKGILIFILGPGRVKSILSWWSNKSPLVMRLLSLVAIALGAMLAYSA